jgi:hypothetical protein
VLSQPKLLSEVLKQGRFPIAGISTKDDEPDPALAKVVQQ